MTSAYQIKTDLEAWEEPADAPPSLLILANRKQHEKAAKAPDSKVDLPQSIARARALLRQYRDSGHVPGREEDGDDYPVCCELLNLGLSQEKALEVALEVWAPEPHSADLVDFLETTLRNAATYAQNDTGAWAVPDVRERLGNHLERLLDQSEAAEAAASVGEGWQFGLHDPVSDATLAPITYRDVLKLWPDSPGFTVTQVIAGPKQQKTNFIMAELFRLAFPGARHGE